MSSLDSLCYFKPKINMNVASGCPLFIEKTKILSDGFIKNDCIYIEIVFDWISWLFLKFIILRDGEILL